MSRFANLDPFARKMIQGSIAFAIVLLIMFGVFTAVYMHANPKCHEETIVEADSPGGQWTAAVIERRCGDTTSPVTHLNLRPAQEPVRTGYFTGVASEGQVFAIPLDVRETSPSLEWTGADELTLRCIGCDGRSPSQQETSWRTVKIRYVKK